ncbi:MAG: sigma-70 family RNA polymerase sigma factor [Muribaculaceae bacterium]|nr:sigma-70 family RNA polymerase sigma factor [Muribaculaceae bacterium]
MENFITLLSQQHFEADRQAFINYLHTSFPALNGDDITDIYVEVWIDVIDNVRRGKTERVKNWKSYIFGLGWKRACKLVTRNVETERIGETANSGSDYEAACLRDFEESIGHIKHLERIEKVMDVLTELPAKPGDVLRLYYLEGLSTEEIAERLGYSGQRTVITLKRRSVALLKERVGAVA